jgi:hypothetical protein
VPPSAERPRHAAPTDQPGPLASPFPSAAQRSRPHGRDPRPGISPNFLSWARTPRSPARLLLITYVAIPGTLILIRSRHHSPSSTPHLAAGAGPLRRRGHAEPPSPGLLDPHTGSASTPGASPNPSTPSSAALRRGIRRELNSGEPLRRGNYFAVGGYPAVLTTSLASQRDAEPTRGAQTPELHCSSLSLERRRDPLPSLAAGSATSRHSPFPSLVSIPSASPFCCTRCLHV